MSVANDYRDHVFQLYKEKSGLFSKVFSALILFAVIFFIAIVVPLSTLRSKPAIDKRLSSIQEQVNEAQKQVDLYQRPQEAIKKLRERVQQGPQELIYFIQAITASPDSTSTIPLFKEASPTCLVTVGAQRASTLEGDLAFDSTPNVTVQEMVGTHICKDKEGQDLINCQARYYVLLQLCEYQEFVEQEVVYPLAELRDEDITLFSEVELESKFQEVVTSIEKKLDENPQFWHTVEGKIEFSTDIDNEIKGFSDFIQDRLAEPEAKLSMRLEGLQEEADRLESEQSTLDKRSEEITRRLGQITSPVGKLPFSIAESVLMFPILLALVFVVCAIILVQMARLRHEFYELYKEKDTKGRFVTPKRVAVITPLWIDPQLDFKARLLRWLVLLIPFILAIITFCISISSYSVIESDIVVERGQVMFYQGLSVLALLIFVYCYWKIWQSIRQNRLGE